VPKFIQTVSNTVLSDLESQAKKRGVSVQELLRAVIIPEWIEKQRDIPKHQVRDSRPQTLTGHAVVRERKI